MPSWLVILYMGLSSTLFWRPLGSFYRPYGSSVQASDLQGSRLPFISPFPVPGCFGVNIFAQSPVLSDVDVSSDLTHSASPTLFAYFLVTVYCTRSGRRFSALMVACSSSYVSFAYPSCSPLLVPSKDGYSHHWSLPWDLLVFRFTADAELCFESWLISSCFVYILQLNFSPASTFCFTTSLLCFCL